MSFSKISFFEKEESKIIHREIKLKMWIKPSESSAFIILITDNFISRILQCLHRANNAPLDKNAINLAEIPVFERCFKYGTSPDYIPKKIKETPEMIVSVKLYA